jgi:hypothetical protein
MVEEGFESVARLSSLSTGFSSSSTSNHCTNISSHQAGLTLISLWIRQHLQNAFREVFVDFGVSRNRWETFVTGL